jgi:RNA polymerase sigma-70 factor (ECF subfamily)
LASDFAHDLVALLPRLRRFARALAGAPDRADDLVQSACERALRARDTFQPGTRFDAWMFRILRNVWIDAGRRAGARGGEHAALDEVAEQAGWDGREVVETRLMLARTRDAIAALPPESREVVVLVCVEELSYREAAEVLDIPVGTVMSRLSRARVKLAKTLGLSQDEDVP